MIQNKNKNINKWIKWVTIWLFLGIFALIWISPILWMVSTSLKPESEVITEAINWIPQNFTLENYRKALFDSKILRWILNSTIVSIVVTTGILLFQSMAAYSLSRIKFKGSQYIFLMIIAGMMIPPQVLVIPLYLFFKNLNMISTYPAILLPQIALPLGIFIFKQFFDAIPHEMEEAAQVDGCSFFRIYWNIILPMSRPVLAAVGIFHFIWSWNYFFWPLIIENSDKMYTLPVGLATFQGTHGLEYGLVMAGVVIASIPALTLYIIFQEQLVKGVTLQQK